MKLMKKSPLLMLTALMACSTMPHKQEPVVSKISTYRSISSMNEILNDPKKLQANLSKLLDGIFQSYIMGQVYLQNFDGELDKDASGAMKSNAYSSLLSVRFFVDKFEHDINDLYLNLVLATALPEYTSDQKYNAQMSLDTLGEFLQGVRADKTQIPENLRPLILANIIEKQTHLYDELKAMRDGETDQVIKDALWKQMIQLRGSRRTYSKELASYKVDPTVLKAAIQEEGKKQSYKKLEKDIKALSKDMKAYINQIGRGTSADAIFPSAGANGNITGKSFPAKTWALTYDDGPAKTTPQVLQNLKDKNIPATFFMLAQQVEKYPNTFAALHEAKMDMACHSYTHAQLPKLGPAGLEKEITTAKKVIDSKLPAGQTVKLFRLPYGAGVSVANVRAKIAASNMIHVFWTVDTLDWQDKNPNTIFARALKQMNASAKNAGVILFHDIHPQSVTASAMVMDHFNKEGLTACTVQGVIDQLNKNLPTCK